MNKELIKKYKAEFDHWINGGEVLFFTWKWYNSKNNPNITFNHSEPEGVKYYIINDEYVEFRKALAEGKTVQYYVDGFAGWQDVDSVGNHCISGKNNYRIKPEESQFKIGDWVIDSRDNNLKQVVNPNSPAALSDYVKWKPQPNEWVIPESGINDDAFIVMKYNSVVLISERCQPFIGQLPTHLKDI